MTTTTNPEITSYDNRGTDEVPFGFVYFADGSRVGYAITRPDQRLPQMWNEEGPYWQPSGPDHILAALVYLRDNGVIKP